MEKFSIDLRSSAKGERKKAVRYLREKGFEVKKRSECNYSNYLSNNDNLGLCSEFMYYHATLNDETILTLPSDWDKLVEIVEGKEFKIGDWVVVAEECLESSAKRGHVCKLLTENRFPYPRFVVRDIYGAYKWKHNSSQCTNVRKATPKEINAYILSTFEKTPTIAGYELKRECNLNWSLGCKVFRQEQINQLTSVLKTSGIDSFVIKGSEVKTSELDAVIKYIDNAQLR